MYQVLFLSVSGAWYDPSPDEDFPTLTEARAYVKTFLGRAVGWRIIGQDGSTVDEG